MRDQCWPDASKVHESHLMGATRGTFLPDPSQVPGGTRQHACHPTAPERLKRGETYPKSVCSLTNSHANSAVNHTAHKSACLPGPPFPRAIHAPTMARLRKHRSQRSSLPSRSGLRAPRGRRQPALSPEARGPCPSDPKHSGSPRAPPAGRATPRNLGTSTSTFTCVTLPRTLNFTKEQT